MSDSTTHRASFSPSLTGTQFTVEQLIPGMVTTPELSACAKAMGTMMLGSWRAKLPDEVTDDDIAILIPDELTQMNRIISPKRNARYWVAHTGGVMGEMIDGPNSVNGFLRVEEYNPRNPFKQAYPNITDMESRSGFIRGQFEKQAAALLYFSLGDFENDRMVSAYDLEQSDGIELYEEIGFKRTSTHPTQTVGTAEILTVHMEAPSVALVRQQLVGTFPWLDVADMY